jgi:hypothetical protein
VPLIAFICVLESVWQRKKFSNWKTCVFFLFQEFDLRFFTQMIIIQQCLDPNPNPNFFSNSDLDPAKIFDLFRIGIHNIAFKANLVQGFASKKNSQQLIERLHNTTVWCLIFCLCWFTVEWLESFGGFFLLPITVPRFSHRTLGGFSHCLKSAQTCGEFYINNALTLFCASKK